MLGILVLQDLNQYFEEKLKDLKVSPHTNDYLIRLFSDAPASDFSNTSLTLLYANAKFKYDFETYQNLADWILFQKTINPGHLIDASDSYYNAIAQNSYYKCYLILRRQWKIYEELADFFPKIVNDLRKNI